VSRTTQPPAATSVPAGGTVRTARGRRLRLLIAYAVAVLVVALATLLAFKLHPLVDPANIIMVYLLAVVLVAARLGHGPSIVATVLSVGSFVYCFVPHENSLVPSDLRYLATFTILLCVGLIVATLTSRLRAQVVATQQRELRSQALYQLSRGLAAAETRSALATVVRQHVQAVIGGASWLLERRGDQLAVIETPGDEPLSPTALTEANRVWRACTTVGRGAAARRSDDMIFLPMFVANQPVGLLCCRDAGGGSWGSAAALHLLEAFANNAAIALHRLIVGDEMRSSQQRIDQEQTRNVLLSSMSHDFRTPLASIMGAITTLIDNDDKLDRASKTDLMMSIREDVDYLERQVRNMLDLMRLESGILQIRREWHPPDEVIGGAMTRVEPLLVGRQVTTDIPPTLPLVAIDAILVEQLLVNLLENAARYTPAGTPVDLTIARDVRCVRIAVADRGPGIPATERERVFNKFYRGDGARRTTGAGLGLAICRAIAVLHGGRIWVEDRPGGGAVFQFELPIVEPPQQPIGNQERPGVAS
jgi:two-component system sensor histidine kinase KdpD